jgi:hypothetical protein
VDTSALVAGVAGLESVDTTAPEMAGFDGPRSADTSAPEIAGFGFDSLGRPALAPECRRPSGSR